MNKVLRAFPGNLYSVTVRLNCKFLLLAISAAALTLLGAGCSGINASHSVSPIDFFLPGAGGFLYNEPKGQTNVQAGPLASLATRQVDQVN